MKLLAIALLIGLSTVSTLACKCAEIPFPTEVTGSTDIFIGTPLRQTVANKAYFLFAISRVFKGQLTDTTTIQTGLGGPACGIAFEIGKPYIVFAHKGTSSSCSRTASLQASTDLGKLTYTFQQSFADSVGKSTSPLLNASEAQYFNSTLKYERGEFNFQAKKVGFFDNTVLLDKQQYFERWRTNDVVNQLLLLTDAEKHTSGGYDAIIVSWRKQGVSRSFRRHLLNRLSH